MSYWIQYAGTPDAARMNARDKHIKGAMAEAIREWERAEFSTLYPGLLDSLQKAGETDRAARDLSKIVDGGMKLSAQQLKMALAIAARE